MRRASLLLAALAATVLGATPCHAKLVARDLLGGIGGFENSVHSAWVSSYAGSDYDWDAPTRWSYGPTNGYRWGHNLATVNDTVAEGWTRESDLNPDRNLVYRLMDSASGKCQHFAIKGLADGNGVAYLLRDFSVGKEPYKLNSGDAVTFSLDSVSMAGYEGLDVTYEIGLQGVGAPGTRKLAPSTSPSPSSVSGTVLADAKRIRAFVKISVRGGTASRTPGISVDGAHLTIRRGGSPLTEEIPPPRNRSVKTMRVFVTSDDDAYAIARDYDRVDLQYESDYWFARRLKYYNPDIKVYLYEGPWVNDWREKDHGNRDPAWSDTPLGMAYVLQHDARTGSPDWLYRDGDSWSRMDSGEYLAHLADKAFQSEWAASAFAKVLDYKLDGLFIDGPAVKTASPKSPAIEPWEEQSFLHAVMAKRPAGVDVIHNACSCNLVKGFNAGVSDDPWLRWLEQGLIFFDPSWKPQATGGYTASNGYTANSPDNTFDGMYQESAFWGYGAGRNWYKQSYATNCLNDMDTVKAWNAKLPENRKKWMHIQARGADRPKAKPADPAHGIDGWVNFGLCLYLLGQNEWTTLGLRVTTGAETTCPTAPFGDTANLDSPAGERAMSGTLGLRRYFGGDAGAKGGIVVANIADTGRATYSPEFDTIDQDGVFHPVGSAIDLGPHTGRILYHQSNHKHVSVVTSPAEGAAITGASLTIRGKVIANRPGLALPSVVQVRIDDGDWLDCPVDAGGAWSRALSTQPLSPGAHTVSSRAYVSASDVEPGKRGRTVVLKG